MTSQRANSPPSFAAINMPKKTTPDRQATARYLPAQLQDVCFAKQNEANRKNERDERDLVAQEVTAAWTRVTAFAAIVGVVASIFGLGLIWAAYQATQDTNRITRDLGRKQLRAYLTIDLQGFFHRRVWRS